jgi:hypothetical protein
MIHPHETRAVATLFIAELTRYSFTRRIGAMSGRHTSNDAQAFIKCGNEVI